MNIPFRELWNDCGKTVTFLQGFILRYPCKSERVDSKHHLRFCKTELFTLCLASKLAYRSSVFLKTVASQSGAATLFLVIQRKCAKFALKRNMGSWVVVLLRLLPSECTYPKGNCQLVQCSARPTFSVRWMNSTALHVYLLSLLYRQSVRHLRANSPIVLCLGEWIWRGSWATLQAFWSHDKSYPQINSCSALPVAKPVWSRTTSGKPEELFRALEGVLKMGSSSSC